jgi:hypothetical protein
MRGEGRMIDVLLRDDDANATSDPDAIAATYAPLLDDGHSIAFAVVPDAALDVPAPDGAIERFVGPHVTELDRVRGAACLDEGRPMVRWLRDHARDVDVFQHGLSHARVRGGTELGALTLDEARDRIGRGRAIVEGALARAPSGFVAPWDALSRGSLEAAAELHDVVSTGWLSFAKLPARAWPSHVAERCARRGALTLRRARVLRHGGCVFTDRLDPADADRALDRLLAPARFGDAVRVVVLHHWQFAAVKGAHPVVVALARALRARSDARVVRAVTHAA